MFIRSRLSIPQIGEIVQILPSAQRGEVGSNEQEGRTAEITAENAAKETQQSTHWSQIRTDRSVQESCRWKSVCEDTMSILAMLQSDWWTPCTIEWTSFVFIREELQVLAAGDMQEKSQCR
tara:strand:+ start:179 stop:541 length:363 start_codon:yes stop_codon:yes gene_type:complete